MELRSFGFCATFFDFPPCHAGTKDDVPVNEPGLGKVGLDTDNLVVYVVIVGRIAAENLERVKREAVAGVVVDGLAGGEDEEEHRLADRETGDSLRKYSAERVEQEALDRVIVERAVSIRHVQPVMDRVEVLEEEPVNVHRAVEEVLPRVEYHPEYFIGKSWLVVSCAKGKGN